MSFSVKRDLARAWEKFKTSTRSPKKMQSQRRCQQTLDNQHKHEGRHRTSLDDDQVQDEEEPGWDPCEENLNEPEPPTPEEEAGTGEANIRTAEEESEGYEH